MTITDPAASAPRRRHSRARTKDGALVEALLLGLTYDQASERAGVSKATVKRRMAEPGFQRRLAEAQEEHTKQVRRRLTSSAVAASQILVQIAGNADGSADRENARTRIYAARALLQGFVALQPRQVQQDIELHEAPVINYMIEGIDPELLR